jgi:ribosomal protein L37AE/L43A
MDSAQSREWHAPCIERCVIKIVRVAAVSVFGCSACGARIDGTTMQERNDAPSASAGALLGNLK